LLNELEAQKSEKFRQDVDLKDMKSKLETFDEQKQLLHKNKLDFESQKDEVTKALDEKDQKIEQLKREFETALQVENDKHNKLSQDNMQLKHNLDNTKKHDVRVESELVQLLKEKHMNKDQQLGTFDLRATDELPGPLSKEFRSTSELQTEIFDLKLLLVTEQNNSSDLEILSQCLKNEIEQLFDKNKQLRSVLEAEREKFYAQSTSKDAQKVPQSHKLNIDAFKNLYSSLLHSSKQFMIIPL